LRELGKDTGMLGKIFFKSQNEIHEPAMLYRLIQMIDEQSWVMLGADVKGDIYEGLLAKNAEDVKSGAGQYFTPRTLIKAIVACMRPEPEKRLPIRHVGLADFFWPLMITCLIGIITSLIRVNSNF